MLMYSTWPSGCPELSLYMLGKFMAFYITPIFLGEQRFGIIYLCLITENRWFLSVFQQCELYHWVDLLDRFDGILCDAGQTVENMSWLLVCDRPDNGQLKALLLAVLNFTALLIEYSFSRHLYSSIEVDLNQLLPCLCFSGSYTCQRKKVKQLTNFNPLLSSIPTPFAALNHLVSVMWHAGGLVCAEPALCVQ